MQRIARFEPRRLPDAALDAVPVLLGGERLAEAAAVAVVGDAGVDAELEGGLAGERRGQIDLDRRPAVAVRRRPGAPSTRISLSWNTPSSTSTIRLPAQSAGISTCGGNGPVPARCAARETGFARCRASGFWPAPSSRAVGPSNAKSHRPSRVSVGRAPALRAVLGIQSRRGSGREDLTRNAKTNRRLRNYPKS